MEQKTHIRKMQDNNYLGEWDLPLDNEGKKIATIEKIEMAEVVGVGQKKSTKPLVYFKEYKKPLVLNATNRKAIQFALKSCYIEDWIGKKVTLFRQLKVKAFNEYLDCIRIEKEVPIIKLPLLDEKHPKFEGAVNSVKAKTSTKEEISVYYELSESFLKAIQNETV